MFYVYMRYTSTGREHSCGIYDTVKEAIEKIALCYRIDKDSGTLGDAYYFYKQR